MNHNQSSRAVVVVVLAALSLFVANSNTHTLTLMAQQDSNRCQELLKPSEIPSPALINFDNLPNDTVIDVSYQSAYGIRFENTNTTRATIYGQEPTKSLSDN